MDKILKDILDDFVRSQSRVKVIQREPIFRRDENLIPTDVVKLNRIDRQLRILADAKASAIAIRDIVADVNRQIAYDEGADITDGASDDEK